MDKAELNKAVTDNFDLPSGDYSENMKDAWIVLEQIKKRGPLIRLKFLEIVQMMVSDAQGLEPSMLMAWPDLVFFLNPEIICVAAIAAIVFGSPVKRGNNIVQFPGAKD